MLFCVVEWDCVLVFFLLGEWNKCYWDNEVESLLECLWLGYLVMYCWSCGEFVWNWFGVDVSVFVNVFYGLFDLYWIDCWLIVVNCFCIDEVSLFWLVVMDDYWSNVMDYFVRCCGGGWFGFFCVGFYVYFVEWLFIGRIYFNVLIDCC